ncbi:MAG: S-layer protein, contains zincin protease domain and Ig-fold domain [Nitrosopumilales archaeon]|nr:MAG: S-layer protein, contains zincin protease domain and Ig-fold domain [Nitrosopumilales archaeon]
MFTVNNELLIGGDAPLTLLLNTDKDEYALGETVQISGRPSKLVYLENIVVTVIHEDELQITCGKFVCGQSGSFSSRPAPSQSGLFTVDYAIPISDDAKGKYEIIADTEFGVYSDTFIVTDKPLIVPGEQEQIQLAKRTTEKFNRIPDSFVPISVAEKIFDGVEMLPRVLQGSLLTPIRGEEANVNLKISTEDGTCIIGQESDCLVTDSTRGPGTIYKVVEIDGVNYKVRYSGIDARLEKFTILPESSDGNLLDSTWNVEVIKDDQPSRLYYKITYVLPE